MPVYNCAESFKFIFLMNRLNKDIRINMLLDILKCIDMHTVEPFLGMLLVNKVFAGRKLWFAEISCS